MLVLSRRRGESIVIGGNIRVTVVSVTGKQVKLSIDAPRSISVHRSEIWEAIRRENEEAMRAAIAAEPGVSGAGEKPAAPKPLASLSDKGSFSKLVTEKSESPEESSSPEASESKEDAPQDE